MQAEARRRSRINERLDALRKIVPHTERANTALFLEDVVKYVQRLQNRVAELESKLGLPPTVRPLVSPILFNDVTGHGGGAVTEVTVDVATASPRQTGPEKRMLESTRSADIPISGIPSSGLAGGCELPTGVPPPPPPPGKGGTNANTELQLLLQQKGQNGATDNAVLPSISEELEMAAQLAPSKDEHANEATVAESEPAIGKSTLAEDFRELHGQNLSAAAGRRKRLAASKADTLGGVESSGDGIKRKK